ncbi:MAG: O-antigen ligase family protein [Ignavibacteria bacterium]|nr:O-antigen ligase family protein [Ignavibacteria bacterium]
MENSNYSKIAKITFLVLIFFSIWGTALPFRESVDDVDQGTGSNIINQILFSFLFIMSVITLFIRKRDLLSIIKREKFFSLILLFSLASILWSEYSFITFKRIFQIIAIFLTCTSFLIYADSADDIIKPFKYILYPYLLLTVMIVFIHPGAIDPLHHTWRGFTSHKNLLGQISIIAFILCYIIFRLEDTLLGKSTAVFMQVLSVVILVGTYSSTSIISLVFLTGLASILSVDAIFRSIHIGKSVSFIIFSSLITLIVGVIVWFPEYSSVIPQLFGKDTTFSGRTDLWEYLLTEASIYPLLGVGFSAYWVPESHHIMLMYKTFVWLPGQAHNGFLDILLQLGYVGLSLIVLMLINYFLKFIKIHKPHPWIMIILITIIINFQESTILRPGRFIDVMFIFAYMLLFINHFKSFIWQLNVINNE